MDLDDRRPAPFDLEAGRLLAALPADEPPDLKLLAITAPALEADPGKPRPEGRGRSRERLDRRETAPQVFFTTFQDERERNRQETRRLSYQLVRYILQSQMTRSNRLHMRGGFASPAPPPLGLQP